MTYRAGSGGRRHHTIHPLRTPTIAAFIAVGLVVAIAAIVALAVGALGVVAPVGALLAGVLSTGAGLVGRGRRIDIELDESTGRIDLSTRDFLTTSSKRSVLLAEVDHVAVTTPEDTEHAAQVVLVLTDGRTMTLTDSWVGDAQAAASSIGTFLGRPSGPRRA